MDGLNWEDEPDLYQLRRLHALLLNNPPHALVGLERLAERGSLASALYLAEFYMKDESPYANASKARYWYSKAQDKGYPPASYMLGRIYSKSRQYDLAFAAFSKGAEKGYAPAIYRLAKMSQVGEGAPQDISEYRRLLEMARAKRHIFAKRDLAGLLLTGRFGLAQALRGAMMLLSLWSDVAFLVRKTIKGKSIFEFDERVLA